MKNIRLSLAALMLTAGAVQSAAAFSGVAVKPAVPSAYAATPKNFSGNVSWYGEPFNGKKTASGKIFDMNKCTSAHLHLPFFTKVLVEDPKSGKSVVVTVLDRGPYVKTRVMDLAREAAKRLGTLGKGVSYVECTVLDDNDSAAGPDGKADAKPPAKAESKAETKSETKSEAKPAAETKTENKGK